MIRPAIRSTLILAACVAVATLAAQANQGLYATSITIGIFALLAVPLGLMYGHVGVMSLAQGGFAALGGYGSAILATRYGWHPVVGLPVAVLLPAAVAYLISRRVLRLPELSLALATLAFALLLEVALRSGGRFTGGYEGLASIPPLPLVGDSRIGAHLLVWALVAVCVYAYESMLASPRGRALKAVHVDRLLAESMGFPVARELTILFSVVAGLAGLAGWFYAHYIGYLGPASLGVHLSANLIFMVVVGGRRYALGPVLGAVFFVMASDLIPGQAEAHGMVFGALLILVLLLLPGGFLSLAAGRFKRRRSQPDGNGAAPELHVSAEGGK
ncbi:MAG: branched-chain amino acid ABC transporter permease [Rubrivivax sp.]